MNSGLQQLSQSHDCHVFFSPFSGSSSIQCLISARDFLPKCVGKHPKRWMCEIEI
ncbi:hypothetical protein CKA32_004051 [Geitlerinema sp. FC II]|nr:hypothetical protein CKA32_004051 [Geitlerinema sp. FC II]